MPISITVDKEDHGKGRIQADAKCKETGSRPPQTAYEALVTMNVTVPPAAKDLPGLAVFVNVFSLAIFLGPSGEMCVWYIFRKQEMWKPNSVILDRHWLIAGFFPDCDPNIACSMYGQCSVKAQLVQATKNGEPFGEGDFDEHGAEPYQVSGFTGAQGDAVPGGTYHKYTSDQKKKTDAEMKDVVASFDIKAVDPSPAFEFYNWDTIHVCKTSDVFRTPQSPRVGGGGGALSGGGGAAVVFQLPKTPLMHERENSVQDDDAGLLSRRVR